VGADCYGCDRLGKLALGKTLLEVALGKNPLGKYLTSAQMLSGGESS